jgi:hypothetical protein
MKKTRGKIVRKRIVNAISLLLSASALVTTAAFSIPSLYSNPAYSNPDSPLSLKNNVVSWKPDYDIKSGIIGWMRDSEEKIRATPPSTKNELLKIVIAVTADILHEAEHMATIDKKNILRWLDLYVVHILPLLYGERSELFTDLYYIEVPEDTYAFFMYILIDLCYIREKIEIKKNSIKSPLSLWHWLWSYLYKNKQSTLYEPIVTLGSKYERVQFKRSDQEKSKSIYKWFDAQRKKIRQERIDDILTWIKKGTENVKLLKGNDKEQALEVIKLLEEIVSNEHVINHKERIRQEKTRNILIWIKDSRSNIKHLMNKEDKDRALRLGSGQALETIRLIEKILEEALDETLDDAMWDDILNKDITKLNDNMLRNKQQELKKEAERKEERVGSSPDYKEKNTDSYTNPFANGTDYVIISWVHSIITHMEISPEKTRLTTHGISHTCTYFVSLLRLLNEALKRTEDVPHAKFSMELPLLPITVRPWDRIIVNEDRIYLWSNSRTDDKFRIELDFNGIKRSN